MLQKCPVNGLAITLHNNCAFFVQSRIQSKTFHARKQSIKANTFFFFKFRIYYKIVNCKIMHSHIHNVIFYFCDETYECAYVDNLFQQEFIYKYFDIGKCLMKFGLEDGFSAHSFR